MADEENLRGFIQLIILIIMAWGIGQVIGLIINIIRERIKK